MAFKILGRFRSKFLFFYNFTSISPHKNGNYSSLHGILARPRPPPSTQNTDFCFDYFYFHYIGFQWYNISLHIVRAALTRIFVVHTKHASASAAETAALPSLPQRYYDLISDVDISQKRLLFDFAAVIDEGHIYDIIIRDFSRHSRRVRAWPPARRQLRLDFRAFAVFIRFTYSMLRYD